ncbi:MAG: MmcQ/YjbR family DNA-binding protein [Clostridia bacterium]|nr:MmcQ/YjbR family DNA-binding protein [Clostridia bacterium]
MNMDLKKIHDRCMSQPGAEVTYPFGPTPVCYKLHGKIFAMFFHEWQDPIITLKCQKDANIPLRALFPDHIIRAYHLSDAHQPYWFSVRIKGFPEEVLLQLIDEAYDALRSSIIK